MKLKTQTKTIHYVNYNDFDHLVNEVYGIDYEIIPDMEKSNDSSLTASVKKSQLDTYDQQRLDTFKSGGHVNYMARLLLQDLVNNDYAPEGDYVIDISW